jgi:hypothetical protein
VVAVRYHRAIGTYQEATMSVSDAQKSEVHASTGDASTSPVAAGDTQTTHSAVRSASADDRPQWPLEPLHAGTQVVRDDTDEGGPLVVKSSDPNLNPPSAPRDPFPTERKQEIDPPAPPGSRA